MTSMTDTVYYDNIFPLHTYRYYHVQNYLTNILFIWRLNNRGFSIAKVMFDIILKYKHTALDSYEWGIALDYGN